MKTIIFNYTQRRGTSAIWDEKTDEIILDGLDTGLTEYEIKGIAIEEFISRRRLNKLHPSEYVITEISLNN